MRRFLFLSFVLALATTAYGQDQPFAWPKHVKAPIYPAIAKTAHVSGDVVIQVTLDADGVVTKADVVSGPPLLKRAALDSVRIWTFMKPPRDGFTQQVTCAFRLDDKTGGNMAAEVDFDFPDRVTVTPGPSLVMTQESSQH